MLQKKNKKIHFFSIKKSPSFRFQQNPNLLESLSSPRWCQSIQVRSPSLWSSSFDRRACWETLHRMRSEEFLFGSRTACRWVEKGQSDRASDSNVPKVRPVCGCNLCVGVAGRIWFQLCGRARVPLRQWRLSRGGSQLKNKTAPNFEKKLIKINKINLKIKNENK